MEERFELFKNIVLINSPDEISVEDFLIHGDFWYIGSGLFKDTYFYIGIPMIKLKSLYYA